MPKRSLQEWLDWQQQLHGQAIDLGLERMQRLLSRLGWLEQPWPVITVAGTNGKGSTVAFLEALAIAHGLKCASYTSPHILRYNERVRLQGEPVGDAQLCEAFEEIEAARGDMSLTCFEYATLAALSVFRRHTLDLVILEVGLGGRLDAVNAVDADVAVVTTVALDHLDWLGDDLAQIGREKAGIFRQGKPAVIGDPDCVSSVEEVACDVGAGVFPAGRSYSWQCGEQDWVYHGLNDLHLTGLPFPALPGKVQCQNAATAVTALSLLPRAVKISSTAVVDAMRHVTNAGRFQWVDAPVPLVMDVAHNPQAAQILADNLTALKVKGRILTVSAMLADKQTSQILQPLLDIVDHWYLAGLDVQRGMTADEFQRRCRHLLDDECCDVAVDVDSALQAALSDADSDDIILVFGSFHTVEQALLALDADRPNQE